MERTRGEREMAFHGSMVYIPSERLKMALPDSMERPEVGNGLVLVVLNRDRLKAEDG